MMSEMFQDLKVHWLGRALVKSHARARLLFSADGSSLGVQSYNICSDIAAFHRSSTVDFKLDA